MRYLITHYTEYRKNAIAEIKKIDEEAKAERLIFAEQRIS